jgi:hypothetical protein
MKPEVILHLNFNLENGHHLYEQIGNLKTVLNELKKISEFENVRVVQSVKGEIGLNEEKYLELTGKSRMNHRHKEMSREQQAAHYLKELGVDTFPISDTVEDSVESEQPLVEDGESSQSAPIEDDEDPLS